MESNKKVVDLIYIEPQKDEATIIKNYRFALNFWKASLKTLQEQCFERHYDSAAPDVLEILNMRKFLGKFLQSRLDWVVEKVADPDLRKKYLNVLPPFQQKGGIKTLLLHFYQMSETEDKRGLVYKPKNEIEKEIAVLWDNYKLKKTIESIETIQRALTQTPAFPSLFSVADRLKSLESLKKAFQLMFQMCIKKEYQKALYQDISAKLVSAEAILERVEKGESYVYPHVIKKFDYRNHFFYVYYYPGMKAKIGGSIKEFRFNYLDFEIIKQEFLIHWMNEKLKDNPNKKSVYAKYAIGGKTIEQIVAEDPKREIEILQQLPINLFNDITAEVNREVSDDLKTTVEAFSENQGQFAEDAKGFIQAANIARFSLQKLKQFVSGKKEPKPEPPQVEPAPQPVPEKVVEEKPVFEIIKIKKNQIDFPFFGKETAAYKQRLALLRVKLGAEYTDFSKRMSQFFGNVSETALIQRRTPKHEVIYPHLVKETKGQTVTHHLIILGAEVKAKQLGMAYGAKSGEGAYAYTCFFVYGCDQENPELGEVKDKRNARGIDFNIYDFINPAVQARALQFYRMVMDKNP